jgi:hydrogenase nickel incorporation protein HypA/HybF
MHELSLASAIVGTVERHAGGRRVEIVAVRVGGLRQVVPESLELYFGFVAEGTICEGARLELEIIRTSLACGACGEQWEPPPFRCAACASSDVSVLSGEELEVESIVIEEKTCIASA